jgi:mannose-1-phosphate guanylyltransferase
MEKADNVLMVKAQFPWDDVGAWSALRRVVELDGNGNYLKGNTICIDTKDCVVHAEDVKVGVVGVSGLIIVASREGVLVCDVRRDQDTRQVARMIEKEGEDA